MKQAGKRTSGALSARELAAKLARDERAHARQAARLDILRARLAARTAGEERLRYQALVRRVRQLAAGWVPREATALVVSKGDPALLQLRCRATWHFPRTAAGDYTGYAPASSLSAIAMLEGWRACGGDFLVLPSSAFWWLDHYDGFRRHLEGRYRLLARVEDTAAIWSLTEPPAPTDCGLETAFASLVEEFEARFERQPIILNWHASDTLETQNPQLTMFRPPDAGGRLPYLDRTADIVVTASRDRASLTEARRVAAAAVVRLSRRQQRIAIEWQQDASASRWPTVSIVMPCYNGSAMTAACLQSLLVTLPGDLTCEVIVVDDASTDSTGAMLARAAQRDPRVKVLRNDANLGFVGTCNRGASQASGEILVFVNNDLVFLPGWLRPLLRVLRDRSDAGACGGKLVFPDGTLQEAGGLVFDDGSAMHFGRGDTDLMAPLYSFLREVDYCSGALLATPRVLFTRLGGFGAEYVPGYYEDTDYCFKVRDAGLKVYFQPDSTVVHREGGTAGTDLAQGMKRHQVTNQTTFMARWYEQLRRQRRRPGRVDAPMMQALSVRDRQQPRALVCALMPEVDRDSGSRRIFDLIAFLRDAGWAVSFVSQHERFERRYAVALEQQGTAVFAGAPRWMPLLIAAGGFDLAVFGLWHVAEPFVHTLRTTSPHLRIIIDSIDLHFLRLARGRFLGSGSPRLLDADYGSEMVRELNTYAAADGVLTVSAKEAGLINDMVADPGLAHVVPDNEDLPVSAVALAERSGMVFVGCYRHAPNVGAVEFLCKEVLPLVDPAVLARHPVYIVGDGLDETVRAFGQGLPSVRMVGWTPSVLPYVERARASVIPLRFGAGTKRKVLQTLMLGTPAVSTHIGAEGFQLCDREHLLLADSPAEFALAIETLLQDDTVWAGLASRGREHIVQLHGRQAVRQRLADVVAVVMAKPPKVSLRAGADAAIAPGGAADDVYRQLIDLVLDRVDAAVPPGSTVVVVNKGDGALLRLRTGIGWHFPQNAAGAYSGHHPADSEEAIRQLEAVRRRGAQFFVVPGPSAWWLGHYAAFAARLERTYAEVGTRDAVCAIFDIRQPRPVAPRSTPAVTADTAAVRLIAFHLPQFHPIPENDRWWGNGFTEWTNVRKAEPQFPGHDQPRVPADLGYYDLRSAGTRAAQAALAQQHGIHGFCYYHYWFGGKRLLEQPVNAMLASGEPDFPFCLCWANEPWSRRWDGQSAHVLQSQTYSAADDVNHIRWLLPALTDRRAIHIDGKPLFIVYQGRDLPDPARTVETWRREVAAAGLPGLYLLTVETGFDAGWDATRVGFDAKILFAPQFTTLFNSDSRILVPGRDALRVFDYGRAAAALANPAPVDYRRYETVCPGWDNSPRRGGEGVVLHNATPEAYERWLREAVARAAALPPPDRVVFINAWNEWAEGAYLEPDLRHGRAFLEATARALETAAPASMRTAMFAGAGS